MSQLIEGSVVFGPVLERIKVMNDFSSLDISLLLI